MEQLTYWKIPVEQNGLPRVAQWKHVTRHVTASTSHAMTTTFASNQEHRQTRKENKSGHSQHEWHFLMSSPWYGKSRKISTRTPKLTTISEKYKRTNLHFRTRRPWHDKTCKTSTGTLKSPPTHKNMKEQNQTSEILKLIYVMLIRTSFMTWRKAHSKSSLKTNQKEGHVMENWLKTPKRWKKETKNLVYKLTRIFAWIQSFDSVFQGKTADKASRQHWLSQ